MAKESIFKTFTVAFLLCVVCSILVCLAALVRIDREAFNQQMSVRKTVLAVAGYQQKVDDGADINELFVANMEKKIVELATGKFTTAIDAETFNQDEARHDPEMSVEIPADLDIGKIGRRAKYAAIFIDKSGTIILPVRGTGMWGVMYAYLAIAADGTTVKGLKFYRHSETPGLGAEITNPNWERLWPGKELFDNSGRFALKVVKRGEFDPAAANAIHTVDGLAGSTITADKVQYLIHYWLGEHAFGPLLTRLEAERG